ncbi:MAG: hypothetical protein DHS20C15_33680 [Planctomycetota bacterium]|nr:MAG: hypothetical protein DHS20C15_33680 [Planctomycetota bacterium]
MTNVSLALVSHTNVGKTTLARTLLRADVGTVFDQAHVTELSEAWTVIEHEGARLQLWDTPGFGDTARLLRRLRRENDPLGWFLHQVWDRLADRALWCGQEALRTLQRDADLVLYLVNATEDPEEAGYVNPELEVLGWVGKPVVLLLNQTGAASSADALLERWREATKQHDFVAEVLPLDAFTRCWVQEGLLLEQLGPLLSGEKASAMQSFASAWSAKQLDVFTQSVQALAACTADTLLDEEALPSSVAGTRARQEAMDRLAERQEARETRLMDTLIDVHGLDGDAAARLHDEARDVLVRGQAPIGRKQGAIWGGLLSGAATGVGADLVAQGLTFGSGAVVGAVLGALGGAGLARGFEFAFARGKPCVSWSAEFHDAALRRCLLRYLAVAQFGRGRGVVQTAAMSETAAELAPWRVTIAEVLASRDNLWHAVRHASKQRAGVLGGLVSRRGSAEDAEARRREAVHKKLDPLLDECLRAALKKRFPDAAGLLG